MLFLLIIDVIKQFVLLELIFIICNPLIVLAMLFAGIFWACMSLLRPRSFWYYLGMSQLFVVVVTVSAAVFIGGFEALVKAIQFELALPFFIIPLLIGWRWRGVASDTQAAPATT